jgi:hypothetical protein
MMIWPSELTIDRLQPQLVKNVQNNKKYERIRSIFDNH